MSINDLRSRVSAIARRNSRLSKGGADRLTIRLVLTLPAGKTQVASGRWLMMSFISGTVTLPAIVRSYCFAINARITVERLREILYSMPSR